MRIGIIQASSQRGRNAVLEECTRKALAGSGRNDTVINYGVYPEEEAQFSYIEAAINASLLLATGTVDFIITGCSSGQGMMLACNSLPDVRCGYLPTPQDAYLFGRINDGNAVSLPLGLNYGWAGEINLQCTLDKLFDGAFGGGYPPEEAERKKRDTEALKRIGMITRKSWPEVFDLYDRTLMHKALQWKRVQEDIRKHGKHAELMLLMEHMKRTGEGKGTA